MSSAGRWLRAMGVALAFATAAPAAGVGVQMVAFLNERSGPIALVEAEVGPVCHHRLERTVAVAGRPLPVCARCTGLYVGAASGGAIGFFARRRRHVPRMLGVIGAAVIVAVGAALLERLGGIATGNGLRVALGVPLGLGPALIGGLGARLLIEEGRG